MNSSKKIRLFLLLALALVMTGGSWGYRHLKQAQQSQPSNTKPSALSVSVVQPESSTWPQTIKAQGPITAWQESSISTEIGGLTITQVLVDVGSQVKQGQVLVILNSENTETNLHQQQAAFAQAKANLNKAKADASRAKQVSGSGALSEQKIQEYLLGEETAQANFEAAKAALDRAKIDMRRTKIVSPDQGVISSQSATLGAVVNAGTELFKLVRQNRLEWRAEVGANQLSALKVGQTAMIALPDGTQVQGHIRTIAPTLSNDTRTALVYINLPKHDRAKAGMFVEGLIQLQQTPALTLPESALVLRDGLHYVFEVDSNNQVLQRAIKVGRRQQERVEVLDGIAPNAQIASSGGAFLNQGDLVHIVK